MREPAFLGERRRTDAALHHRVDVDIAPVARLSHARVLVHHRRQQVLIERSPVHTDPNRLVVRFRDLDDGPEILIPALAADVAGVDAVLRQRRRAAGVLREEQVTVVVKVPDDRHGEPRIPYASHDLGNCRGGFVGVDCDAHQLRPGIRERDHLCRGSRRVRCIGIGHRLHDNGVARTHGDTADVRRNRLSSSLKGHYTASISYLVSYPRGRGPGPPRT